MHVLLALMTLALSSADGSPDPARIESRRVEGVKPADGPMIAYEVRFLSTTSLDWRGKLDPKLRPVARQGGAVVWSVDAATLKELHMYIQKDIAFNLVSAPMIVTPAGGEVSVVNEHSIKYVAHLERIADGPVNQATKIAFKPEVDEVHSGIRARFSSGKVTDQGMLAHVVIDKDLLQGFSTSNYTEEVQTGVNRLGRSTTSRISSQIQIPKVESARVDGEWVIPKDGALIVSLGASPRNVKSKGLVRETNREDLVMIQFRPMPGAVPTPASPSPMPNTAARPGRLKNPSAN